MLKRKSWWWLVGSVLLLAGGYGTAQAEAVCARVKIEIKQELTLERQGFDAMMRINNGLDTTAIDNVLVTVNFKDENGATVRATSDPNDVGAAFFIRVDSMDNISDVSGTGSVAPGTTAEIHWLIIPAPGAAADSPTGKLFFVGANLSYTLGGVAESVDVTPDFITVKPLPKLTLDYFLTRDVIADDPFTAAIEPIEPYTLGVRVKNDGIVAAHDLKIDSAQPKIVENEQGLLIGFEIIGSTVDDQPVAPVLLADFGTVDGNASRVGRWVMTSTLSGEFVEFNASFTHADELGGAVTSLLEAVNTHSLLHDVRVDLPGRDDVRDFLALDGSVYRVYESDGQDTAVSDVSNQATLTRIGSGADYVDYRLTFTAPSGFGLARIPDPEGGRYEVRSAKRSDGKDMLLDNVWTSKTRNRNTTPPSWDHQLNLLDANGTGSYVIRLGAPYQGPVPPVMQFIPNRVTYEGGPIGFVMESSDPNGETPSISVSPLPAGAKVTDNGDGTAYFDWIPAIGQAGTYVMSATATDGALTTSQAFTITVNPDADRDGDGMDDDWEQLYFATLARDGTGDYDGDGFTDLQEFQNGTDPTRSPGPGQPTIVSPTDGAEVDTQSPTLTLNNGQHSANMTVVYQFEVYTDTGFTDLVDAAYSVAEDASGQTAWTVPTALTENTWYYWRGRAYDGAVGSDWVRGSFFVNTVNDLPGAVTPSSPADGALVPTLTPTLEVTNSTDPDGDVLTYTFSLYSADNPATPVAEQSGVPEGANGTTQWVVPVALQENGHYNWGVTVTDEHGATARMPEASFLVSTINDAPVLPTVVAPAIDAEVAALDVTLEVTSVTDPEGAAVTYVFEIDTVETMDSPDKQVAESLGTPRAMFTGLTENTHYFWRAKASDGEVDSAWVQGRFFANVANDAPAAPVADSPGQSGWVGSLQPTLRVIPGADPDGDSLTFAYEVYRLDPQGVVVELVASGTSDQPFWQVPEPFAGFGWYAWRAQQIDEHDAASPWMSMVSFFADDDGVNDVPTLVLAKRWPAMQGDGQGNWVADPVFAPGTSTGQRGALLQWTDADPDSNALISLGYRPWGSGSNSTEIAADLAEDPDDTGDQYVWDTTAVSPGLYQIRAAITDGNSTSHALGENPVLVGDGGGLPYLEITAPGIDKYVRYIDLATISPRWQAIYANRRAYVEIAWRSYDADSATSATFFYKTSPEDVVGTPIEPVQFMDTPGQVAEGTFLWRVDQLPIGDYYIYAEITDGNSMIRVTAPGVVHITKRR